MQLFICPASLDPCLVQLVTNNKNDPCYIFPQNDAHRCYFLLELQTTKKMQPLKYFLTCKQQWKSDLVMLKVCQRGEIAKSQKQGEQFGNRLNVTKLSRTVRITKLFGLRGDFRSFAEMNNFAWLHSCNMQNVLRPFLKLSVSVFQSYLNLTAISLEVHDMNFSQVYSVEKCIGFMNWPNWPKIVNQDWNCLSVHDWEFTICWKTP